MLESLFCYLILFVAWIIVSVHVTAGLLGIGGEERDLVPHGIQARTFLAYLTYIFSGNTGLGVGVGWVGDRNGRKFM